MCKNVLFILVDDLRPELNCFGKQKLHTPNIDALAAESLRFDSNYCQTPLCIASRGSLFSGILNRGEKYLFMHQFRRPDQLTLPGVFKAAGYETVSIGKSYHMNHEDDESWTRRYTHTFFDEKNVCDGYCSGFQSAHNKEIIGNMARNFSGEKGLELPPMTECVEADDAEYPDFKSVSYAIDELARFQENKKPFFMTLGLYRPHLPWAVPKKYWDLYKREEVTLAANQFFPKNGVGKTDLGDARHYGETEVNELFHDLGIYQDDNFPVLSEAKQREFIHGYWASVSFMDAQVGRIIRALKAMGMEKDTVVVFAGDNGWHLGEHKLWSKVSMFEESTRVPMMMRIDGVTKGTDTRALTELLDIYPTLCDLCEIDIPEHVDGVSLRPLLYEGKPVRDYALSRNEDAYTVRYQNYRFTYFAKASEKGDIWHLPGKYNCELFNLETDRAENISTFPEQAEGEIVRICREILEREYHLQITLRY